MKSLDNSQNSPERGTDCGTLTPESIVEAIQQMSAEDREAIIRALGGGKYEVAGKLDIKGNAQDVVVPVTLTQSGANTVATGAFTIKRLAFKIGENEWTDTSMVADDVQIKLKLALTGVPKL